MKWLSWTSSTSTTGRWRSTSRFWCERSLPSSAATERTDSLAWQNYLAILRRRWPLIAVIFGLTFVFSVFALARQTRQAGYQSCETLYVADVSSPSLISAPQTTLETAGQLLAGETAANFFGDDILDVAQSRSVARFIAANLSKSPGGPSRAAIVRLTLTHTSFD